jgi:hypothetical protein
MISASRQCAGKRLGSTPGAYWRRPLVPVAPGRKLCAGGVLAGYSHGAEDWPEGPLHFGSGTMEHL